MNQNDTKKVSEVVADMALAAENIVTDDTSSKQTPPSQMVTKYDEFKEHSFLMYSTSWSSVTTPSLVYNTDIMNDFFTKIAGTPLGFKLENFRYVNTKIKLTVVVQGTTSAYGKLVLYADPMPSTVATAANTMFATPQLMRCMLIPNIEIDPSQSKIYELILDCNSQYGVYGDGVITGSYRVGHVVVNTLTPGSVSVAAPVCDFKVYMSLVNPQLGVATFTSQEIHSSELKNPSDHAMTFSNAMKSMSDIPILGPVASLFSSVSSAGATALKWFGFSKPFDETRLSMGRFYTMFESKVVDGKMIGNTLASRMLNSIGIGKNVPMYNPSDMDIETLAGKYALIQTTTILPAVASLTKVLNVYVTPTWLRAADTPVIANGFELTPLAWVTAPYQCLRCDFKYKIEFVCSIYHRVTILVAYCPNVVDSNITANQALYTVKTWSFQVSGNSVYEIEIPWAQPYPFIKWTSNRAYGTSASSQELTNGVLNFYVLNPVTSNGTGGVYMNIYVAGCNLKMGIPNDSEPARCTPALTASEAPSTLVNPLCIPDNRFYTDYFGEEAAHTTKEMASRFSPFLFFTDSIISKTTNITQIAFPLRPTPASTVALPSTLTLNTSLLNYLQFGYVGYRGSINMNILPDAINLLVSGTSYGEWINQIILSIIRAPSAIAVNSSVAPWNGPGNLLSNFVYISQNVQKFMMAKFPYYFRGLYDTQFPIDQASSATDINRVNFLTTLVMNDRKDPTATSRSLVAFQHAAGDDYTFIQFRGIPTLIIV